MHAVGRTKTVQLFLFERAPTVDTGVAVRAKGAAAVGYGVPVREDQHWWGGEVSDNLAYGNLRGWRKSRT